MGELVATLIDFFQKEMNRSAYHHWVSLQFLLGTQIDNNRVLARLDLPAQLLHRDACRPQLAQKALSLPVFVARVERGQSHHQPQRAAAHACDGLTDLVDLIAEEITDTEQRASVEQRSQ